jgi:ATP-binding cassette subfamily F protein uup
MNCLSVTNLRKFYGERLLLDDITFHIDKGQKVALIAKNGSGKSTLIKILQGIEPAESGEVKFHKDLRVGFLVQDPEFDPNMNVYQSILNADHPMLRACLRYEEALAGIGSLEKSMEEMDLLQAWDYEVNVKQILTRFLIHDLQQPVRMLSGGQKKRLALAILLLQEPDFIILDEPTNHLDLDMIEWLEDYLSTGTMTLLMITHDRYFLENICTDMLELENGKMFKHKGNYSQYLENKAIREDTQRSNVDKAQNLMRKELEWIRRQPKARGTKAKARVDAFEGVKERASQKVNDKNVQLEVRMSRLGGKILELHNVSKAYGDRKLIDAFSYKFKAGERVGIVGRNGCGKSTLLNILTGKINFDSGNLVPGETVVFGYYGQEGLQLKSDRRVIDVVKDIAEYIPIGKGQISAAQMLERFLFDYGKQYQYFSTLSGGERRRLYLLTILMKNPNFLILDEPTNDLDIITLQVLEDFLMDFKGCLIIVSHDRYFLDKLTDHLFVFEGDGKIRDFNGNYREYRDTIKEESRQTRIAEKDVKTISVNDAKQDAPKRKMSYKEQKEFQEIEKELSQLEAEKNQITQQLSEGNQDVNTILQLSKRMEEVINLLEEKEFRWLELSELAS